MISTYAELADSISRELSRDDLDAQVPEWIQMAELAISRYIGVLDGEQVVTSTFSSGVTAFALPTGLKRVMHFQVGAVPEARSLEVVSWSKYLDVMNNTSGSSNTMAVTYIGRTAYLAPPPASGQDYTLVYYGLPEPLSESNSTNDLLKMGADVLKYWALTYSAAFIGEDERIQTWNSIVSGAAPTLKKEYWNSHAGGILKIRPDVNPRDSHWQF